MNESKTLPDPASGRVRVLSEPVARKIAAGEVIDRPFAAVRELLDNAIDSGADEITLTLEGGGIEGIAVRDNGCGMIREDLEICWLPHATSKIESMEDLESVRTLGFRGEALSSMAACSRLEIVSSRNEKAFRLTIHGGKMLELISHRGAPGTSVTVKGLFYNMPARRRFLKSSRGEITMCRRIFLEKAAAHPEVAFRLFIDGVLKNYLPVSSPLERIPAAWPRLAPPSSWWETQAEGDGFRITAVHARPEISRKDRQYIQIYANRRRIDEFALVQAVQYAYDAWMPGGAFPTAFIFIDVDPSLVDFNIHPAKKEARFRNLPAIRHRLVEVLKDRLTGESYQIRAETAQNGGAQQTFSNEAASPVSPGFTRPAAVRRDSKDAEEFGDVVAGRKLERFSPRPLEKNSDFKYLGQVMGVFLVAESSESLFIIDQHAAHERILYEKFRKASKSPERLLIPRVLKPDKTAGMKLELRKDRLSALGLEIEKGGNGEWLLTALPGTAKDLEDSVLSFLEEGAGDAEGLEKALWADLACKAAVKDNSPLDTAAATRLVQEAFALEVPRCPHGRPIWFEVSRRELFELVGRTV
ncbi:MAG: DNA mismatch repair endonuclease MutL [Spirochaetes bacterium]|nr:MAG: DNA mismatch repair endonuclease MutL [Spirochaetota bacterium]